ncbi:hypothetical protein J0A68_01035 [Algoriphagus sp. H41]|uniref:Ig-like domain-containing protein n=1 Tax=Algoriphagus oliviformis TaxID=2811231 RepID=A0ABS3BXD0_9BACT|nr:PKD-like domain-containing protein [Algoriphagus oliviformis]MBN7809518.1 hypothetical protein [Algoriphagus oliviformis]
MMRVLLSFITLFLILVGLEAYAQTQTITTAGPGTFTVPAGVTSITVEVWGGGGKGGSRSSGNDAAAGGGGGAYSRSVIAVSPGQVINYYVGFGATSLSNASADSSWFVNNTTLMAKGGKSVRDDGITGAAGGLSSEGYGGFTRSGGSGANRDGSNGGGGGSSAGITANGNNTTTSTGATAPQQGGPGGNGAINAGPGEPGSSPGGGGGGAKRQGASQPVQPGGTGGNGQIRISYIQLTSATGTDNQSVCSGDPIINTTYSIPIPASTVSPNLVISGLPSGLTSNFNSTTNTITISGTPTATGTYTISTRPTYLSSVPVTLTRSGTVTILPKPAVTNMTTAVCSGSGFTVTPVNGTNGVVPAGTTYSWTAPAVTGGMTGAASGTNASSITGTLSNPTNIAQIATYTVTPTTGSCVGTPFTVVVTVNPTPAISAMNASVCTGSSFSLTPINVTDGIVPAGTTYSWSLPTVTGGMTGGATGSGASNISGSLTNTTSSPQTATYTVTPVSGSCTGPPFTVTITVAPNNFASAASTSPEVCINNAIPSITHSTTGATGIGAATGLPAGVTANWSGNTITISGTPTASGVFNYSIPLTGGCGAVNATGTITVNANNTVSGPSSTPTLCVDTPLTNITHSTTGATGISNAGVSGANGLPTGLSATWVAGVITISGTPTQAGTFNYSIPLTGGCSALFAEGSITVNPATEFTVQNLADQRICDGQNFLALSVTATGTGTLSYQWFSNDNPNKTGAVPVGTNSNSYTPPSNAIGTKYYYVEVTGGCGMITSSFSQATVEPITVITTQPDDRGEVECFGDGFAPLTVAAQGADLTYQWYTVSTPVNTGGTAISGATSSSFTPPSTAAVMAPLYYYVVVSGYCSSQTSDVSGEYLVTPPITTITEDPSTNPQTVCQGDAFSPISAQAIGEGVVSYQWYSNTTNSNTGGTLISGATDPTFTPPSNIVGTLYYYATGSSDCGTVPTAVSGAFTVTPPTEIQTESLGDQTICDGDSFAPISVNAIGTGSITYQWYSNTAASTSGGTLITGANSASYTPPATAPGTTTYYYVMVGSNCGPNVTSNISGPLTVNPLTTVATHPSTSSQTVCPGAPFSAISVSATGPGTLTYQWYSNSSNSNSGGTAISGATSASFTPPSASTGTTYYYVEVTSACETIPSNVSGAFHVNQNTQIDFQNTATQSVCIGLPFNPISVGASGTGTLTYQWYSNTSNSNSGGTLISGATTSSFTPPSSAAGTTYYYVVVGSDCGPNVPSAVSGAFVVYPEPIPTFVAAPGTSMCEQSTTTYTTQTGKSNYIWNISGVAGTDYTITSGGVGSSSETVTIQWLTTGSKTVTVGYTEPATGCIASTTASSTTTVEPFATVGPPSVAFPSVCISNPALAPFTRPTTGVTGIANSGVPGANGLPPGISASFNVATGIITFSGTATTTGLYTYSIPLSGNCINGLTATGTIDVSPNYVLTSVSSVSATSAGGSATVTINGSPTLLSNGSYEVTYILDDGSTTTEHTSSSFGVSGGRGSFSTVPLTNINVDVFKLTIKSIKKVTDVCSVNLNVNDTKNITFFSVCGATITSNRTFTVPAGIYEITILATGAGATGQTSQITIPVVPGEPLGVFIGQSAGTGAARNTYVTRDSSSPTPATSSIIYVNGGGGAGPNGQVSISYSCPDANKFDCIEVIDDGAISGTTLIRFTCDDTWEIPEGLVDFSIYAIGGGGGGGMSGGNSGTGGGGGGGGFASTTVTSTSPYGISAGNSLNVTVGQGGPGAGTVNLKGENGVNSTVTSTIPDPSGAININLNALGGGGGASFNNIDGSSGASGGGGAYSNTTQGFGGSGTTGQGRNGGNSVVSGGTGAARSGGGGGGAGSAGGIGKAAGSGNTEGGNGGEGLAFSAGGTSIRYGAGGGGLGYNQNGNSSPGIGGFTNGIKIGGDGNLSGVGNPGQIYTGSGGGAGTIGGGNGAQGVVYISYFNYRILSVEYLHFDAQYNPRSRAGELTWATAKEWENSHFEVERSVDGIKNWTVVGQVSGAGYSEQPMEYAFQDLNLPLAGGNVFYRLRQVDFDGESSYSVTKSIQVPPVAGTTYWRVYPNPTNGDVVNLELLSKDVYHDEPVTLRIISSTGQFDFIESEGNEALGILVSERLKTKAAGVYTLEIAWGANREYHKIILRR